jgi:hypothetical protein
MRSANRCLSSVCRVLMLTAFLIAWFGHAHADEETQVYMWVADEMQIGSVPAMPYIHFVDKDSLQAAFKDSNHASFIRWEAQYGEAQALQIMGRYLQGMVGLFVANTETIFVYQYLPPCRRRATLAHEFCHFFQYFADGELSLDQYDSDILHLVREMQAYKIEKKYMAEQCVDYGHVVF